MKIIERDTDKIRVRCETCGTNGRELGAYTIGVIGSLDEATRLGKDHERQLPYHIVRLIKPATLELTNSQVGDMLVEMLDIALEQSHNQDLIKQIKN